MYNEKTGSKHFLNDETEISHEKSGALIEPLSSAVFTWVFGKDESKKLTRNLINAILRRAGIEPIGEIRSIEAESNQAAGSVDCRTGRVDVRVVAASRRIVDLEAQLYPEDIDSRSLYYGSQIIVGNTPKGAKFKEIPQVVVITLLDDTPLFPEEEGFVSLSRMAWRMQDGVGGDSAKELRDGSDRMLFVLVELEKVRKRYNKLDEEVLADPLLAWLYLLTSGFGNDEEADELRALGVPEDTISAALENASRG